MGAVDEFVGVFEALPSSDEMFERGGDDYRHRGVDEKAFLVFGEAFEVHEALREPAVNEPPCDWV